MMLIFVIAVFALAIYISKKTDPSNRSSQPQKSENKQPDKPAENAPRGWEATWHPSAPVKDSGKCGENAYWTLYEDGTLTIRGSGDMYDYDFVNGYKTNAPWFPYHEFIRYVKVGYGITMLGDWSFGYCHNLETAELADSIRVLARWGFMDCGKLKAVNIPRSARSIASDCFSECYSLQSVRIPNGVTAIYENAFYRCKNLSEVSLPDSLVGIDDCAFAFCFNLRYVRIPPNTRYIHPRAFQNTGVSVRGRGTCPW